MVFGTTRAAGLPGRSRFVDPWFQARGHSRSTSSCHGRWEEPKPHQTPHRSSSFGCSASLNCQLPRSARPKPMRRSPHGPQLSFISFLRPLSRPPSLPPFLLAFHQESASAIIPLLRLILSLLRTGTTTTTTTTTTIHSSTRSRVQQTQGLHSPGCQLILPRPVDRSSHPLTNTLLCSRKQPKQWRPKRYAAPSPTAKPKHSASSVTAASARGTFAGSTDC